MPYARAEGEPLEVLDWIRMCRSALSHAETCMIEAQMAAAEGKNPLPLYRAGSHHIKRARECFSGAVERCNDLCSHSYPGKPPKEYINPNTPAQKDDLTPQQ